MPHEVPERLEQGTLVRRVLAGESWALRIAQSEIGIERGLARARRTCGRRPSAVLSFGTAEGGGEVPVSGL